MNRTETILLITGLVFLFVLFIWYLRGRCKEIYRKPANPNTQPYIIQSSTASLDVTYRNRAYPVVLEVVTLESQNQRPSRQHRSNRPPRSNRRHRSNRRQGNEPSAPATSPIPPTPPAYDLPPSYDDAIRNISRQTSTAA